MTPTRVLLRIAVLGLAVAAVLLAGVAGIAKPASASPGLATADLTGVLTPEDRK